MAAQPFHGKQPGPKAQKQSSTSGHGQSLGSVPFTSCVTLNESLLLSVPQFPRGHQEVPHTDSLLILRIDPPDARHIVGLQHRKMVSAVIIALPAGQPCTETPGAATQASVSSIPERLGGRANK